MVSDGHGKRFYQETATMEKRYQWNWSTPMLANCCWTLASNAPEQLHKRQAKRSDKQKQPFIVTCLTYLFLKHIINVCGFLRNSSHFWVSFAIFVLSASKLIRHSYYYLRSIRSVKICYSFHSRQNFFHSMHWRSLDWSLAVLLR
jgi:hypothetical protein